MLRDEPAGAGVPDMALDRNVPRLGAQHVERIRLRACALRQRGARLHRERCVPRDAETMCRRVGRGLVEVTGEQDVDAALRERLHREAGAPDQA